MNFKQFKENFAEVQKDLTKISVSFMEYRYKLQEMVSEVKEYSTQNRDEFDTKMIDELNDMIVYVNSMDSSLEILFEQKDKVKKYI